MKKLSTIVLSLVVIAGIVGVTYLMLGNSGAEAREGPQNFVVALQGTATGVETSLGSKVFCFDVDMVDLATGRVIGVGTDCLDTNPTSMIPIGGDGGFGIENTTTFHLPGGTITSVGRTTVQPAEDDGTGRAMFITGEVSDAPNITGTGRFEGATGSTRLSGIVDMTHFLDGHGTITFDCIFVIDIN